MKRREFVIKSSLITTSILAPMSLSSCTSSSSQNRVGIQLYSVRDEMNKNPKETLKNIPKEKLLIETDSPFLAPVPMRGKKNEPAYIKYTLKKLSEIKGVNLSELEKVTTNNFNKLFFN